jgi:alcohol dehydrogenase class IV
MSPVATLSPPPGTEVLDGPESRDRVRPAPRETVSKFQTPEIVFGPGALAEAGFAAGRLGAQRPFVVTDPGIIEAGWTAALSARLGDAGLCPTIWSEVTPNPKDTEVTAGFKRYEDSGCDVIIAIGGGSCIDAAKAIAILTGNGGAILDYGGVDRVTRPIPPLLMIPTTAGTGADVSQFCVITDTSAAVKVTIMGRALVPDISVTDPRLLTTMPDDLAAATGLDALTHGIEAYVSRAHNPLSDGHALHAVRLVFGNLPQMLGERFCSGWCEHMALASLEAGMAFTNALLGATHALSHQVGGMLDLPHGVINGVLLPHVIRFNAACGNPRFVQLAQAAGLNAAGAPGTEAAYMLADKVQAIAAELGVPRRLAQVGVTAADIPALARTALDDACLAANPRAATQADLAALLRDAL